MIRLYSSELTCLNLDNCFDVLPAKRRERIIRLKVKDAKLRVAGTYLLLKRVLEEEGVARFGLGERENGKPYLCNSELCFSLSSSGNRVVCAVSDSEIGVDCQKKGTIDRRLATRFCTETEMDLIHQSKDPDMVSTIIWTRKESLLKFTGEGLSVHLNDFNVFPCNCSSYRGTSYNFNDYIMDGYVLSVCSQQKTFPESVEEIEI